MADGSALCIGHSHVRALQDALKLRKAALGGKDLNIQAINRRTPAFLPEFQDTPKGPRLNTALIDLIKAKLSDPNGIIVSCIGGNQHNALGLARHQQPFDFISAERPDLGVDKDATLIPYGAVRAVLAARMAREFRVIRHVAALAKGRFFHLESPPPRGDAAADPVFLEHWTKTFGGDVEMAPVTQRLKFWRLHSSIAQAHCAAIGAVFVPVPADALTDDGYRAPEASDFDDISNVTHANAWYGEQVLRQVDALIADHAAGVPVLTTVKAMVRRAASQLRAKVQA